MNALERGSTLIATRDIRFNARNYRPGDKFDYRRLSHAYRRTVERMLQQRKIVELTEETMRSALQLRKDGGPPRGFTLAGLKALGILTEAQIAERGWGNRDENAEITDENAEPQAWEAPEGSWKVFAEGSDEEKSTDDTTLWIVPFKTGGAPRYFVHGLDGERLNGDASIGGKAKAEEWARSFMAERAAREAAKREGDPDWSKFPENEDDWTEAQIAEFDAWYDALQPGVEVEVEHAAVAKLVQERRDAEAKEAEMREGGGEQTGEGAVIDGLTTDEAAELLEAMTEDELRAHVAHVTGRDVGELAGLTPLALREMALEAGKGEQNDGDVQPGAGQ